MVCFELGFHPQSFPFCTQKLISPKKQINGKTPRSLIEKFRSTEFWWIFVICVCRVMGWYSPWELYSKCLHSRSHPQYCPRTVMVQSNWLAIDFGDVYSSTMWHFDGFLVDWRDRKFYDSPWTFVASHGDVSKLVLTTLNSRLEVSLWDFFFVWWYLWQFCWSSANSRILMNN